MGLFDFGQPESESSSRSGTSYNERWMADFQRAHGRAPTYEEILAGLPKGGGFAWNATPSGAATPAAGGTPGQTPITPATYGGGQQPAAPSGLDKAQTYPGTAPPAAGTPPTGPTAGTGDDLRGLGVDTTQSQVPSQNVQVGVTGKRWTQADIGSSLEGLMWNKVPLDNPEAFLKETGLLDIPGGFTKEDVWRMGQNPKDPRYSIIAERLYNTLAAREQIAQTPGGIPASTPSGDPNAALGGTGTVLQRIGFGDTANVYAPPPTTLAGVQSISAPTAAAAEVSTEGGSWDQFGRQIFEAQYRPQEREILRQADIGQKNLQGQLAAAGLATSGTGIGQLEKARTETQVTLQNVAKEAANTAAVQQFGMKYAQDLQNAQFQQQTNLANAGFSLEAQKVSAGNVLQGNMADAEAYLKTIGLNETTAAQGRQDFLNLMGIQEQDLARMDQQEAENIRLALNYYLQMLGTMGSIGEYTYGMAASTGQGKTGLLGVLM